MASKGHTAQQLEINAGKAKKISTADKFTQLFDQDYKTMRSSVRDRAEYRRSYDPMYSWDARADNPESFSRLQATYLQQQPCRPITLSGAAVVELENTTGFNALNVKQPDRTLSSVPLTLEQRDIGMAPDLSGVIPTKSHAAERGETILLTQHESYRNNSLQGPQFETVKMPEFMKAAGSQADKKLLKPSQRREILEFEKKQRAADLFMRAAQSGRSKTKDQMTGLMFHRGVLMVDSADNVSSEVYGQRAAAELERARARECKSMERSEKLANVGRSISTHGNILNPDTLTSKVKTNQFYQSKGGKFHALTREETHDRIFNREEKMPRPERTQRLRDIDTSGNPNNIITNAKIEVWPPKPFAREVKKVLTHPSQHALEGTRNLQGSLRMY